MKWLTRRQLLRRIDMGRVLEALKAAERRTSGEIRVSIAPFFWGDVRVAAELAFRRLGMTRTALRNGVLIFVVPSRRKFVVLGDEGIHASVGQSFWERVAAVLSERFHAEDFTGGLVAGIAEISEQLALYFPHRGERDVNELPDAIDLHDPEGR